MHKPYTIKIKSQLRLYDFLRNIIYYNQLKKYPHNLNRP